MKILSTMEIRAGEIWFSGWVDSPTHKMIFQTTISLVAAVICIAIMEMIDVPLNIRRWLELPIAIAIACLSSFLIHTHLWKQYTPYMDTDVLRLLHSQQALPAPANARCSLAVAMFLSHVCIYGVVADIWYGGPIWRLGEIPFIWWCFSIMSTAIMSFRSPFNKVLSRH